MKIKLFEGKEFSVDFTYNNTYVPNTNKMSGVFEKKVMRDKRLTTCTIFEQDEEVVSTTVSCYYNEKYSKAKGRKEALTKALEMMGLTRGERRQFWSQYHALTATPKKITILLSEYEDLLKKKEFMENTIEKWKTL